DDIGEGRLVEPAPPLDNLAPVIAEMRDRPAERGQPQPEENAQDLRERAGRRRVHAESGRARPSMSSWSMCRWRSTLGAISIRQLACCRLPGANPPPSAIRNG